MSLSVLALPSCLALLVNTMGDNVFGSEGDFQTKLSEMFDNEDFGDFGDDDLEFSPIADEEQKTVGCRKQPDRSQNMNAESFVKETKEGPSVKRFRSEGDFQTKMSEMFDNEDFAGFGDDDLEFSPIADEEQKTVGCRKQPDRSRNMNAESFVKETKEGPSVKRSRFCPIPMLSTGGEDSKHMLDIEDHRVLSHHADKGDMKHVVVPKGVKQISARVFQDCRKLKSITLPNSLKGVGDYAFSLCKQLGSVTLPNSVESIGEGAFRTCSVLTSVTLPSSLKRVSDRAFEKCYRLTSVTLPDSIESIGDLAFSMCKRLPSITLPNSVESIGDRAFHNCIDLTTLKLPNSVGRVGHGAFWRCNGLTTLRLPNSLKLVGERAFWRCYRLTSVTLPHNLVYVDNQVFAHCAALTSVVFRPPVSRGALIAWAVGNSRNRANWQLTTLKHTRNVLGLITAMVLERRDVACLDPDGSKGVFEACPFESRYRKSCV